MRKENITFTIDLKGHAGITLFGINNVFLEDDELENLFDETDDPSIITGTLKDVITIDDTVTIRTRSVGIPFRSWFVRLKSDGKDFPEKPVEFRIKPTGRFDGASQPIDLP